MKERENIKIMSNGVKHFAPCRNKLIMNMVLIVHHNTSNLGSLADSIN